MKRKFLSMTDPRESVREKDHFRRTRALAGDCTVLLKNDGILPLSLTDHPKIALYGEGTRNTVRGGTGSGMTITRRDYSVEDALEAAGFIVTTKVKEGKVALADLQRCALHVLGLILHSDVYEDAKSWYRWVKVTEPEVTVERG